MLVSLSKGTAAMLVSPTNTPRIELRSTYNEWVICNQSLEIQITMLRCTCTIAGGRIKGANERSFVFVYQHSGDDVT